MEPSMAIKKPLFVRDSIFKNLNAKPRPKRKIHILGSVHPLQNRYFNKLRAGDT